MTRDQRGGSRLAAVLVVVATVWVSSGVAGGVAHATIRQDQSRRWWSPIPALAVPTATAIRCSNSEWGRERHWESVGLRRVRCIRSGFGRRPPDVPRRRRRHGPAQGVPGVLGIAVGNPEHERGLPGLLGRPGRDGSVPPGLLRRVGHEQRAVERDGDPVLPGGRPQGQEVPRNVGSHPIPDGWCPLSPGVGGHVVHPPDRSTRKPVDAGSERDEDRARGGNGCIFGDASPDPVRSSRR